MKKGARGEQNKYRNRGRWAGGRTRGAREANNGVCRRRSVKRSSHRLAPACGSAVLLSAAALGFTVYAHAGPPAVTRETATGPYIEHLAGNQINCAEAEFYVLATVHKSVGATGRNKRVVGMVQTVRGLRYMSTHAARTLVYNTRRGPENTPM